MRSFFRCAFLILTLLGISTVSAKNPSEMAEAWIDEHAAVLNRMSDDIWDAAELGFQEQRSSALLADALENAGFRVERGVAGMKTAFVAKYGSGRPAIAFLAEYDALPGLSQKVSPQKEPREVGRPGHACGHNLLGTASVGAALAVKEALIKNKLSGTITVFGTPAEEGGGGKVYMVRAGLFRDIDAVIAWHPDVVNQVRAGSSLAVRRARYRFTGVAAHAALQPDHGRSALDAVELMNVGANYLREHIPQEMRIHYVVSRGGERPNVVPAEAENWYYIRGPRMAAVDEVATRIKSIADGACLMTGTTVEVREQSGTYEFLPNRTLGDVVHRQLTRVGPPPFDDQDRDFGKKLQGNLGLPASVISDGPLADKILPITPERLMASSDIGDVSWVVPSIELRIATSVQGSAPHTWAFAAAAGSSIGHQGCRTSAKVMAGSALELITNAAVLKESQVEFAAQTKGITYVSPIPAGVQPPERIDP